MGFLDKFKKVETPKQKIIINNVYKKPSAFSGNYLSGSPGGGFSGGSKYYGGLPNYGLPHFINNRSVRINARNAFHDTPEAKGLVLRFADTVVGKGLRLECTPKAEILGITNEQAEDWARDVQARFDSWAKTKKSSRNEINNFYQNQRLYAIFQHRDNDIFTRLYYTKSRELQNPLQIQFLDPQQIKGDGYVNTWGFNFDSDGIERDSAGRAVSYSVLQKTASGSYETKKIPVKGRNSGRYMMLHGFMPEYANQGRGYSRIEHALQEFQDMTDYKISNIKKAISQSQVTMFVKPSQDNDSSNPLEDIAAFGAGSKSATVTDSNSDTIEVNTVSDLCAVDYEPIPEAAMAAPGSVGVFNLKKGEDLKPFQTQQHGESYAEFVDSYLSYVASSTGMPLEVLLMKFNQNYSASRGALILFWRVAEIWREEMAGDFLNPVFESWLSEEIAVGRISAPGFSDPVLRQAWLDCRWVGEPMPNIDPQRTAKAEQIYASMGATNLDRIAQDYNGSDGRMNRQKLKKQYSELPLAPWDHPDPAGETEEEKEE